MRVVNAGVAARAADRRGDDGIWSLHEAASIERVELASIACELSVDEVYADPLAW